MTSAHIQQTTFRCSGLLRVGRAGVAQVADTTSTGEAGTHAVHAITARSMARHGVPFSEIARGKIIHRTVWTLHVSAAGAETLRKLRPRVLGDCWARRNADGLKDPQSQMYISLHMLAALQGTGILMRPQRSPHAAELPSCHKSTLDMSQKYIQPQMLVFSSSGE